MNKTLETTANKYQDLILIDDWLAYQPFSEPDHLCLVVRILRNEFVCHLFNEQRNSYIYGYYSHSYQEALNKLKERAENYQKSGYKLGTLVELQITDKSD